MNYRKLFGFMAKPIHLAVSAERSIGYRLNYTTSNTAFAGLQIYHRRVCKTLFSDLVEVEKRNA